MAKPILPKFNIGDQVKTDDGEVCSVLSYSYVPEAKSFRYQLESFQVDLATRKSYAGVKNCMEEEIEVPEKEKIAPEQVPSTPEEEAPVNE